MLSSSEFDAAQIAMVRFSTLLFRQDRNIVAACVVSRRTKRGSGIEPCVRYSVVRKLRREEIPPWRRIPRVLDGGLGPVATQVFETGGPVSLVEHTTRERPPRPGASIGHVRGGGDVGTYGALVRSHAESLMLTCAHVVAPNGADSEVNDPVFQPGLGDLGDVGDEAFANARFGRVHTLKRGYPSSGTDPDVVGIIDAALVAPYDGNGISAMPHDGVPPPSPEHPAIGLVTARTPNEVYLQPIATVLSRVGATFPRAGSMADAREGMSIVKTGRTTDRTEGTIKSRSGVWSLELPLGNGGTRTVSAGPVIVVEGGEFAHHGDSGAVAVTLAKRESETDDDDDNGESGGDSQ